VEKDAIAFIEFPDGTLVPQIASDKVEGENPIIMLTGEEATLSFNATGFVLDGDATVYGIPASGAEDPMYEGIFLIDEKQGRKLTIDGTLTMGAGATLHVSITSGKPCIVGESGAQIVVTTAQQIWLMDGNNWGSGNLISDADLCNFFQPGGNTKVTNYKLPAGTYTWEQIGSMSKPGWVQQPNS
jgi:hypothetical protein